MTEKIHSPRESSDQFRSSKKDKDHKSGSDLKERRKLKRGRFGSTLSKSKSKRRS